MGIHSKQIKRVEKHLKMAKCSDKVWEAYRRGLWVGFKFMAENSLRTSDELKTLENMLIGEVGIATELRGPEDE